MYNRYIPNGTAFSRIPEEDGEEPRRAPPSQPERREKKAPGGLSGLLRTLHLEDLDTGDVLLLLILLFLFLEGDDMELVITLGLLLLLGLD